MLDKWDYSYKQNLSYNKSFALINNKIYISTVKYLYIHNKNIVDIKYISLIK